MKVVEVSFARITSGDLGGADLALSELTPTAAREQQLDFSDPYLSAPPGVLARVGVDDLLVVDGHEPIALHDADRRRVTLAQQRGRYVLVTFIYTHCPDVCPLITANLNAALRRLGPARSNVRVLAVSVNGEVTVAPLPGVATVMSETAAPSTVTFSNT